LNFDKWNWIIVIASAKYVNIDIFGEMKETIRQKQVGETVKRHFSIILQQEGSYIYGDALVTVTKVIMSPDFSIAKIYLSVYNALNKQAVVIQMRENYPRMRSALGNRIKKHVRRIPHLEFFLDDTLDEMYRLNSLFDKLHDENQMGSPEEE
jgi:ribosome-binding factor A